MLPVLSFLKRRGWVVVLLVALVARLPLLFTVWGNAPVADEAEYDDLGWRLATGRGYTSGFSHMPERLAPPDAPTAYRPPGLPFLVGAIYSVVGHRTDAVRVVLVLLNALGAAAFFILLLGAYGQRVAWLAGLGWALWPDSVFSYFGSATFLSEPLTLPVLLISLLLLDRAKTVGGALATGVLWGYGVLARPYLLVMLPIACVFALLLVRPAKPALRRMAIVAMMALVPVVAWGVRSSLLFHRPVMQSTEKGFALWLGNCKHARGSWRGDWKDSAEYLQLVAEHPELLTAPEPVKSELFTQAMLADMKAGGVAHFFWLEARKLASFFYPRTVMEGWQPTLAVAFVLLPFGVFHALRRRRDLVTAMMLAWFSTGLAVNLIVFTDERYRHSCEPALLLLAVLGIEELLRWRRGAPSDAPAPT